MDITVSLAAQEIVPGQPKIVIISSNAVDRDSAVGAVQVDGAQGSLKISRDMKRLTWIARHPLSPGRYTLRIGEINSVSGKKINSQYSIPFRVVDSKARLAPTYKIESIARIQVRPNGFTRLSLTAKPDGKYVDVMKVAHRKTDKPRAMAFDHAGKPVNLRKVLAKVQQLRNRRYGKFHPQLLEQLKGSKESVPVAIWLAVPEALDVTEKDPTRATLRLPKKEAAREKEIEALKDRFVEQYAKKLRLDRVKPHRSAPVVETTVTLRQARALAKSKDVAMLFYAERGGIEDLDDSMAIAQTDDVHAQGKKGAGVKLAVWENGPDDTSLLDITAFYDSTQANQSEHATHTHGIVKNTEKNEPNGHAPSCKLHSANDKDLDALAWAVKTKGCTVVSQSFHRSSEPGSSSLSYDDVYKDWLAIHWPYPTILQAAGNYWDGDSDNIDPPEDEYVNHKGYNSLAVGNHNDDASAMSASSVFRNPATTHGDRELPEICANGTSVTAVGLTKSGTSMAAPAAAGVTACLQSTSSTLKSWPEGCRAILMAGATKNVTGSTWWDDVTDDVDAADGAGAINAYQSYLITKSRQSRNNKASVRGWDVGTLRSRDFDSSTRLSSFRYRIQVPPHFWSPRHVKVALAWNSKVGALNMPFIGEIPLSSTLDLDFDLKVFNSKGIQVAYSGSWDNSYEIAEFTANPGETYEVRIRRWSGTRDTWYGIAWTVTGSLLRVIDFDRRDLRGIVQR